MRLVLLFVSVAIAAWPVHVPAQSSAAVLAVPAGPVAQDTPVMHFPGGYIRDFGPVPEGPAINHDFTFVNRGKSPIIIHSVRSGCGCMTADWTKEPIRPGKSGTIRVNYWTQGRLGRFEKSVSVYSNARPDAGTSRNGEPFELTLKGEVVPSDTTGSPPGTMHPTRGGN